MYMSPQKSVLRELNAYVRQLLSFSPPRNNRLGVVVPCEAMHALISVVDRLMVLPVGYSRHEKNNRKFLVHVRESIRTLLGVDEVSTLDASYNVLYARLDILGLIATVCYSQAWSAYLSGHVAEDYVDYITSISLFSDITLTSSVDLGKILNLQEEVYFIWVMHKE